MFDYCNDVLEVNVGLYGEEIRLAEHELLSGKESRFSWFKTDPCLFSFTGERHTLQAWSAL